MQSVATPRAGRGNLIVVAIVVAALALAPFVLPAFVTFELGFAGAYAVAILGLIVLTGYNGQISLGHGAFMAVGGYGVAIAAQHAGVPPELAILLAAIVCAAFGGLVGIVALRLAGAYLALATFALSVSVSPLLKRFKDFTGGSQGLTFSSLKPPGPFSAIDPGKYLYYETWLIAGVLFTITWFLLRGRLGRALRALRENELAARAFGIDPARYKALAFAWSAAYAGVGGALVALSTAYVSPDTYGLQLSITLLIGAVLGGLETLWGALIGGIVVEFLPLWAQAINTAASSLIYGISLILFMILLPGGIAGTLKRLKFSTPRPRPEGAPKRS